MYCEVLLKAVLQTNLLVAASANNLAVNRQADAVCLCNLCMLHALASDTL